MESKCPKTNKDINNLNCLSCEYCEYIKNKVSENNKIINIIIEYKCNYLFDAAKLKTHGEII